MTAAIVHLICAQCDQPVGAQRTKFGYTLCRGCFATAAVMRVCVACGKEKAILADKPEALCFKCERERWYTTKPCVRCGRTLIAGQRSRLPDGTACCVSCRPMLADPVACHYCGEVGLNRSRDYHRGYNELACPKCLRDHASLRTCAGCHRNRPPAGERDGHPYCELCFPTGSPPIITCATCKKKKYRFNKRECEDCAWERSHQTLIDNLSAEFQTEWAATLFERYHSEAKLKTMRGHWRKSLKRDVDFFHQLETHFDDKESLNGVLIVRRLGTEFATRYRRAMSFLAHMGLIMLDDDPDYLVERALSRIQVLTQDKSEWISALLTRFLTHMLNARAQIKDRARHSRIPTKAKSLESAIRSAHRLLVFARDKHNATSIRDVSQEVLDLFLAKRIIDRTASAAFLRYVNAKEATFHKLKRRKAAPTDHVPAHLVYGEPVRKHFLRLFAGTADNQQMHWALVCLLNLLYAQLPEHLVQMGMDQVREAEAGYEIRFAKVWLPLDPLVQPLMTRWMTSRREFGAFDATNSSNYLFPGQRSGTHLNASGSKTFRRKHDYDARAGRITAISAMVRNGTKQAKVLTECFGISPMRAIAFLRHFGATLHDQARHAHERYAP